VLELPPLTDGATLIMGSTLITGWTVIVALFDALCSMARSRRDSGARW
jgi:hypothetical protein